MHCVPARCTQCMLECNAFTFSSSPNPIWRPVRGALLSQVSLHIYMPYIQISVFSQKILATSKFHAVVQSSGKWVKWIFLPHMPYICVNHSLLITELLHMYQYRPFTLKTTHFVKIQKLRHKKKLQEKSKAWEHPLNRPFRGVFGFVTLHFWWGWFWSP